MASKFAYWTGKKRSEKTKRKISKTLTKSDKEVTPRAGYLRAEKLFEAPSGKERHHIDGNPLNNDVDNVEFLTRKEHLMNDGRLEVLIKRNREEPPFKGKKHSLATIEKMRNSAKTRKRDSKGAFLPR